MPKPVSDHIEFISGISEFLHDTKFKAVNHRLSRKINTANGDYDPNMFNFTIPFVTPQILRLLYNSKLELFEKKFLENLY